MLSDLAAGRARLQRAQRQPSASAQLLLLRERLQRRRIASRRLATFAMRARADAPSPAPAQCRTAALALRGGPRSSPPTRPRRRGRPPPRVVKVKRNGLPVDGEHGPSPARGQSASLRARPPARATPHRGRSASTRSGTNAAPTAAPTAAERGTARGSTRCCPASMPRRCRSGGGGRASTPRDRARRVSAGRPGPQCTGQSAVNSSADRWRRTTAPRAPACGARRRRSPAAATVTAPGSAAATAGRLQAGLRRQAVLASSGGGVAAAGRSTAHRGPSGPSDARQRETASAQTPDRC